MRLASIDLGFLYGKGLINGKSLRIKSVVGESVPLRFQDLRMGKTKTDHIIVKHPDGDKFVSDLAINQSPVVDFSLRPDRFNLTATSVVADALMAMGLGSGEHEVLVVSGLPIDHYNKHRADIEQMFSGAHEFCVNVSGKELLGKYDVVVGAFIPQPYGVLMDAILDEDGAWKDRKLAKQTVAIIDVGFGTSDIYVCSALDAIEGLTFSTDTAMNHAYSLIASRIEQDFGVQLKLHQIEPVFLSKEFRKHGEIYDMSDVVTWACKATAMQLISEITNRWRGSWKVDTIIVGGGGGMVLYPYIKPHFENVRIAPNAQMAVVNGYNKYGMKMWRDRLVPLHV